MTYMRSMGKYKLGEKRMKPTPKCPQKASKVRGRKPKRTNESHKYTKEG